MNLNFGLSPPHPEDSLDTYKGYMDDVSLWDIALTEEEISTYMNCPPTGEENGLQGYWSFDDGDTNIAYDKASGNDGYIFGCNYFNNISIK